MTDGYVSDIPYPAQFHREMTPAWLDAVTRGLGRSAPDFAAPFRWCELGCGTGLNALVSAATHPLGHFTAIDIDAAQVASARAAATAAGLGNLDVQQACFQDLAAAPGDRFAAFDVIVTHGVLSWISDAQRQAMLAFIRRFLKPGGLVYAQYMTHPGLSAAVATQQLVRRHAATTQGDSAQRAQQGLAFLTRLQESGAGFFAAYPQERHRLKAARQQTPQSLAHELLPEHWQPFHVANMIEEFAAAGCTYRGSATPLDNIDAVCLPAATRPLLAGLDDPALAETVRDIARNQSYRRDLYQHGGHALPPVQHMHALGSMALAALPNAPRAGGLTFDTPIGPVKGDKALFGPILEALAKGPRTVEELSRLPGFSPHPAMLNQAVQMLLWSASAHPVARRLPDPAACWALNRHLAQPDGPGWLAAPALGTALPATAEDMAMARALLAAPGAPLSLKQEATQASWVALGVLPAAS
jgi:cyclopropane fatty-acyl-phospholipid synthase-like methyltransferase